MTLDLVPFRGHTVPVLNGEISRLSQMEYLNWLSNWWTQQGAQQPPFITTYGTRAAEPISASFEGFVSGMLYADGPVAAAEAYRIRVFGQAPLLYQELVDGRPSDLFDDDALERLREPWPGGNLGDLMKRSLAYGDFGGNAFVLDIDDELVLVRPDWVEIVLEKREFRGGQVGWKQIGIIYYEGGLRSNDGVTFLPGEYCHFVPGLPDPLATYRGMSWLTPLVREVQSDKSAMDHKVAFFSNAATPNLAISLPKEITSEQFKRFVDVMDEKHKGSAHAGKTLYTAGGADVTVVGANMQQMDFSSILGKSETRIANAAGVPPTLLSFSEGMQGSSLNAGNYTAAKRNFVDTTMRDLWQNWAGSLQKMDAFRPPKVKSRLWYDGRDIPFLHEDAKDRAEIQQIEAATLSSHISAGWEPETAVEALIQDDLRRLKHTGLTSVQLVPPGTAEGSPEDEAAGEEYEALLDEVRAQFADEDEISRDRYNVRNPKNTVGGGRFRKLSDAIIALLRDNDGDGDPLEDFTQPQLKKAATDLGLTEPRKRYTAKQLKLMLAQHVRGGAPSAKPAKKAAKKAAANESPEDTVARLRKTKNREEAHEVLAGKTVLQLRAIADAAGVTLGRQGKENITNDVIYGVVIRPRDSKALRDLDLSSPASKKTSGRLDEVYTPDELDKARPAPADVSFTETVGLTNFEQSQRQAQHIAGRWDVSEPDLRALQSELGRAGGSSTGSFEERRESLLRTQFYGWQGAAGGAVAVAAIASLLGGDSSLSEDEREQIAGIRANPAALRAVESLGRAVYDSTQEWFRERGITHIRAFRGTRGVEVDRGRPWTSWSLSPASTSPEFYLGSDLEGEEAAQYEQRSIRVRDIPVEEVFSIPPSGYGTFHEQELVVLRHAPKAAQRKSPDPESAARPFPPGQHSWSGHDGKDVTDEVEAEFEAYQGNFQAPPGEREILGRIQSGVSLSGTGGGRGTYFGTVPPDLDLTPERIAEIRAAVEEIASRRAVGSTSYVTLQDVREGLAGRFPREEVDRVMQLLNRAGDWVLAPESNQKMLTPRARLAAVVLGNNDKHALRVVRRGPEVVSPRPTGPDPEQQARLRQADIDSARRYAAVAGKLDETIANLDGATGAGDTERVLRQLDQVVAANPGIEDDISPVRAAVAEGDVPRAREAMSALLARHGITQDGAAGDIGRMDPKVHQVIGGGSIRQGAPVEVVRPGFTLTLPGGPELAREVEVENKIRTAYRALRGRTDLSGTGWHQMMRDDYVLIADLRDEVSDIPRAEFDATLRRLMGPEQAGVAIPEAKQSILRPRDREGGLRMGGQEKHWLQLDDPSDRPLPGERIRLSKAVVEEADEAPTLKSGPDVKAVAAKIQAARSREEVTPLLDEMSKSQLRDLAVEMDITIRNGSRATATDLREDILGTVSIRAIFDRESAFGTSMGGSSPVPKTAAERLGILAPDPLSDLRTLDPEAARDALDLRTVAQLKPLLKSAGLPVSGRKRELVDRLVGHLHPEAGLGESPTTPTRLSAVSPDVEAAQAHVRTILRTELPPSDRASKQGTLREEHADQIRRVMDRQAELVPHTVQRLEEITYDFRGLGGSGLMGSYNPEYGYGSPLNRGRERRRIYLNGRWAQADSRPEEYAEMVGHWDRYQEEGWTARTDLEPLEYTMSHEFGHHVMAMLSVYGKSPYGSSVDEYLPLVTVRPLLQAMDEHLGTDFMADLRNWTYGLAGGRKVISSDYLDKVISKHGDKLAAAISKYAGSGKFHETMAEIWQMYSAPGADPPPAVAAIGRVMQRLAEKAARSSP